MRSPALDSSHVPESLPDIRVDDTTGNDAEGGRVRRRNRFPPVARLWLTPMPVRLRCGALFVQGLTRSIAIPGGHNARLADLGSSLRRGSLSGAAASSVPAVRSAIADPDLASPSSIAMLSTSIKGGLSFGEAMAAQEKKRKKRSKWHLGIRSRSPPHEIMAEVFTAMKTLNMVRSPGLATAHRRRQLRSMTGTCALLGCGGAQDWKLTDSLYHVYGRYRHFSNRYVRSPHRRPAPPALNARR